MRFKLTKFAPPPPQKNKIFCSRRLFFYKAFINVGSLFGLTKLLQWLGRSGIPSPFQNLNVDSLLNQAYGHQGFGVGRLCTRQTELRDGIPVRKIARCRGLDPPGGHRLERRESMRITISRATGYPNARGSAGEDWERGDPDYMHCCVPGNMRHFRTVTHSRSDLYPFCGGPPEPPCCQASDQPSQALPAGHSYRVVDTKFVSGRIVGGRRSRLQVHCTWLVVD